MEDHHFTAPTEEEMQERMENEYAFLQRQFRMASNDSAQYHSTSGAMIRRQEKLLKQLEEIKRNVMTNLTVAKNPANTVIDDGNLTKLCTQLKDSDDLDASVRKHRIYLKEIDTEIQKTERIVKRLRLVDLPDCRVWEVELRQRRRESRLDNRLYAETTRFGSTLAENERLRNEVDHYLQERSIFNRQYNELVAKLAEGKKLMVDLIELASVMYDQRTDAEIRLKKLLEQGKRDKDLQTEVAVKLVTQIDMDKTLKEFVATKGQRRVLVTMHERCEARYKRETSNRRQLIESYKKILQDIYDYTGDTDIDRICDRYQRTDNFCFNVYQYALALHELIEVIRRDNDELDKALLNEREKEKARKAQRRAVLVRLRAECSERKNEVALAKTVVVSQRKSLDKAMERVTDLHKNLQADKSKITCRLGENKKATELTVALFFEGIEHQLMRLMAQCNYVESKTRKLALPFEQRIVTPLKLGKWKPFKPSDFIPTQPCAICVEAEEIYRIEEGIELTVMKRKELWNKLHMDMYRPDFNERLHNLSACRMPRSRKILQRRFM